MASANETTIGAGFLGNQPQFAGCMASSEVDQKFLGFFATATSEQNSLLSSMLYKILGLSVILSKKLIRARKLRRLDPTRETKSLQLYHHILWLSREGLIMVEQYVLPMVAGYTELKVLAFKIRASFYHIFVLFHNQPSVRNSSGIYNLPSNHARFDDRAVPSSGNGVSNDKGKGRDLSADENRQSIMPSPELPVIEGGPVGGNPNVPPGLGPAPPPKSSASFIIPSADYIPTASGCFAAAAALSDALLAGSHPIRLSVKLEYAAFLYDCLHDSEGCRRMAKQAIADVYNADEVMDDESFEDAAELVAILGKMVRRGGKTNSTGGSSFPVDRIKGEDSKQTTVSHASLPPLVMAESHSNGHSANGSSHSSHHRQQSLRKPPQHVRRHSRTSSKHKQPLPFSFASAPTDTSMANPI